MGQQAPHLPPNPQNAGGSAPNQQANGGDQGNNGPAPVVSQAGDQAQVGNVAVVGQGNNGPAPVVSQAGDQAQVGNVAVVSQGNNGPAPVVSQAGNQAQVGNAAMISQLEWRQMQADMRKFTTNIDSLTGMFNDLMGHLAGRPPVPNLPGWQPNGAFNHYWGQRPPANAAASMANFGLRPPAIGSAPQSNMGPSQLTGSTAANTGSCPPTSGTAPTSNLGPSQPASSTAVNLGSHPPASGTQTSSNLGLCPTASNPVQQSNATGYPPSLWSQQVQPQNQAGNGIATTASQQALYPPHNAHSYGNLGSNTQGQQPAQYGRNQQVAFAGYDTDDSQYSGSAMPRHGRQGRGRGPRSGGFRRQVQDRHVDSDEDDPDDGYAVNREKLEMNCKNLTIKEFDAQDKSQDFTIWVEQLEQAVDKGHNPHSKRRHHRYCLKWLPNCLNSEAYSTWKTYKHVTDWEKLKQVLAEKFEDPTVKAAWKTNMRAYTWDEHKVPLLTYSLKVKRFVDKYEPEMKGQEDILKGQYYIRFVCGLPEDYSNQVKMALSAKAADIDKAFDICSRYQLIKKGSPENKVDSVGASVAFQDPSAPSRITQNETEIVKTNNKLESVEKDIKEIRRLLSTPTRQSKDSDYRSRQRHDSGSRTRREYDSDSRTRNAGHTPYSDSHRSKSGQRSEDRTTDRLQKFSNWYRNKNSRGGKSFSRGRSPYERRDQNKDGPKHDKYQAQGAAEEQGAALQTDYETEDEESNVTLQMYEEHKAQEDFLAFCALKDQLKTGN